MSKTNKKNFEDTLFDLPKNRDDSKFYPQYLSDLYKGYLKIIKAFSGELKKGIDAEYDFIENQTRLVITAVDQYYKGFPAEAYQSLSQALDELYTKEYLPIETKEINSDRDSFYRMRISDTPKLKKEELFHVPFQIREKVCSQRYSIPGLPCLYLGDSIYVCWEEIGRPNIDKLHVARFDLSESGFKMLDFNVSIKDLRKRHFPAKHTDGLMIKGLISYFCYWPILAACSIVVNKPEDIFKPEYIIPQLVLQWVVSSQKLDGILYRSNRIKNSKHNEGTFTNLVIPIKQSADKGACSELRSKIKFTAPLSWQVIEIIGITESKKDTDPDIRVSDLRRVTSIELLDGERTDYSRSKFGILEQKLRELKVTLL